MVENKDKPVPGSTSWWGKDVSLVAPVPTISDWSPCLRGIPATRGSFPARAFLIKQFVTYRAYVMAYSRLF